MNNFHKHINLPFSVEIPHEEEYKKSFGSIREEFVNTGVINDKLSIKKTDAYVLKNYDYDDEVANFLNNYDLFYSHRIIFYTSPNDGLAIHIDNNFDQTKMNEYKTTYHKPTYPYESEEKMPYYLNNHVKLNLSFNTSEGYSTIRWWKVNDFENINLVNIEKDDGKKWVEYVADEKDCELIYENEAIKPSIVNTGQLHSTYTSGANNSRVTVSYTLNHKDTGDLVYWYDANKIFEGALYE